MDTQWSKPSLGVHSDLKVAIYKTQMFLTKINKPAMATSKNLEHCSALRQLSSKFCVSALMNPKYLIYVTYVMAEASAAEAKVCKFR